MGCVPTLERGNDKFLLDSWTHLRQHDGFQGNETTGRWSAMGCERSFGRSSVPT